MKTTTPSTRNAESLGKAIYETKPNLSNVVAGFILGSGFLIGGLLMAGYMLRQMFWSGGSPPQDTGDWLGAVALTLMGLALAGGGVLLILFARSLLGFRLRVCSEGFWFTRQRQSHVFAWDEIALVKESVIQERLPLAKGAVGRMMPIKTTRTYTVVRCDGEEFYFDENVIPRPSLLAGPLSAAIKARAIQWETDEQKL
jgi:hypothetical protein